MEDYFELLIFLAFAAFSLLSRFLSPKKKPPVRAPREQRQYDDYVEEVPESDKPVATPRQPDTKPVSFEDVLRELMGESPQSRPAPPPPKPIETSREQAEEEVEARRELARKQKEATKAKRIADKISLEDTGKRIQPLEVTGGTHSLAKEVSDALKSPKNAREAILLSEIINRKYF